ncbi:MAG: InlB B-repeat-containing protein, partial [Bifidobacteriaceae bacterium]|nr:InlB B-repeat-containing protein [Bifidobacteriaceae bacterium]
MFSVGTGQFGSRPSGGRHVARNPHEADGRGGARAVRRVMAALIAAALMIPVAAPVSGAAEPTPPPNEATATAQDSEPGPDATPTDAATDAEPQPLDAAPSVDGTEGSEEDPQAPTGDEDPEPPSLASAQDASPFDNGNAARYAAPLAVVTFTSTGSGTYYYQVDDAADTGSAPTSPEDLLMKATGQETLLQGANRLVLKGVAQHMDTPTAKTVYLVGTDPDSGGWSDIYKIDVPALDGPIRVTNDNTAEVVKNKDDTIENVVMIQTTGADTYKISSGLKNTAGANYGSPDGWWAELNDLDGLRFDTDTLMLAGLTGNRALAVSGANTTASQPLQLTVRDSAMAPVVVSPLAVTERGDVTLNVEGTNTMTVGGAGGRAAINVPQAADGNSGRITITSSTQGQLAAKTSAQSSSYAAGIGGNPAQGAGYITIEGDVRLTAVGGPGGTSASYYGGAGIGGSGAYGGNGGAMGQITIRGDAFVYATTASTSNQTAAIGAAGYGRIGNGSENSYLGDANWVHIEDQATVLAAVPGVYAVPAIGLRSDSDGPGSVTISGGFVVARTNTNVKTSPAIAAGSNGKVTITGGSVRANNPSATGVRGIKNPVDASGQALYPVYVPAASADGVDLTDRDIDLGVTYPLHTLTADQRAWLVASGNYFPSPGAVPLADPTASANNVTYLSAQAWLPAGLYKSISVAQTPAGAPAKAMAADVQASTDGSPAFNASARTNVVAVPVDLGVTTDGKQGGANSTELTFALSPAAPGLALADVQFSYVNAAFTTAGELTSTDQGATYTVPLDWDVTPGSASAKVRAHGYLTLDDAAFSVYWNQAVDVAPLNDGQGRRFFTSILGGARFSSTWPGTMYYQYGGTPPASAQALVDSGPDTAATIVGDNTVPGLVDYSLAVADEPKLYVVVKGTNNHLSELIEFAFPAYTGDLDWFALPGDTASPNVTQTVQSGGRDYRLTGLIDDLSWLNGQDLELKTVPVELGQALGSTARSYTVDGASVAGATVPLRLNGLTVTGSGAAPLALTGNAQVALSVDGDNVLAGPASMAGVNVPVGSDLAIASATKGTLEATGGSLAAGIGGNSQVVGTGAISISGSAQVTAAGGLCAAGIGGGTVKTTASTPGDISISGEAEVTATGGSGIGCPDTIYTTGAGIGGGGGGAGHGGTVTISDSAQVIAVGGSSASAAGGSGIGSGGGTSTSGGTVTISDSASVQATAGNQGAAIGGGRQGADQTIRIMDAAHVNAQGSVNGAAIGGGNRGNGGTIEIAGSAQVTANAWASGGGVYGGAGIGGGYAGAGGTITISGTTRVTATGGGSPDSCHGAGIGGGCMGGMGQVTISGAAVVSAYTQYEGVGIGGNGTNGAATGDFIRITGSDQDGWPAVLAYGQYGGIGGSNSASAIQGSITVEGGFVAARTAQAADYAIGNVLGAVTITGGSVHPATGAKGVSGVQSPVGAGGEPVYPLYIPAYSGADLTDLDLESPPFGYAEHTITAEQLEFVAASDPAAFPAPAAVPATGADQDKLAATLWAPVSELSGITLRGVSGFAAQVKSGVVPPYSAALDQNVLRAQSVTVAVTANGTAHEATTTELTLTFDKPVPGLAADQVTVTDGTVSATVDLDGWATADGGVTWVLPVTGVSGQGTVQVDVGSLPAGMTDYALLGVPATVTVKREAEVTLTPGRNWRALDSAAVVGFGSDVAVVDADNPAPQYWYISQDVSAPAPADGAAVKAAAQAAGAGLGGSGAIRVGAVGTATANSIRVSSLADASAQVVYVAAEYADPEVPTVTHFSKPIAIPVDAYSAPVNLVATDVDVSAALSLDTMSASTWAIDGASGEFEAINGLVLSIADDSLELQGLAGTRRVTANGGGFTGDPIRVRLNDTTIAGPDSAEAVALSNGANVALDVAGTNSITGSGSAAAVIRVPYESSESGGLASQLTIASSTGGALEATKTAGSGSSVIGGNASEGAGAITIGGDVRLTVGTKVASPGNAGLIGGGPTAGKAGAIVIEDHARVRVKAFNASSPAIGSATRGTVGGDSTVTIRGDATVVTDGTIGGGYGGASVLVEGGFVVVSRMTGSEVQILGGSVYPAAAVGAIDLPVDGNGKGVYPLYVPAVLADGTSLTDLDVGGDSLPYVQHTITEDQQDWLAGFVGGVGFTPFPSPGTFPATPADSAQLAAVLWVPVPDAAAAPGAIVGDIKLGQAPGFGGALQAGARILGQPVSWSVNTSTNVVALLAGIDDVSADGKLGEQTTTAVTLRLDRAVPDLAVGSVVVVPGSGYFTISGFTTSDGGLTYRINLAAQPGEGGIWIGMASHSYVAVAVQGEVYRDQNPELTVTDPGTRYFTSIGGNFAVTTNWSGKYYAQVGGTLPATVDELKDAAQLSGDLAYGDNTINDGAVAYGYTAQQEIPAYWAFQADNGNWSQIVQSAIPAYTGDPNWFALPAGTASDTVTQTVQADATNYQFSGLTGELGWLNGRDLSVAKVPVELGSALDGARSHTVDGASVADVTVPLRLNGWTSTGTAAASPLGLTGDATVNLTLDSTNTLTGPLDLAGLAVPPGSKLTIGSSGQLVVNGGSNAAGIGGASGSASGTVEIAGKARVTAKGGFNGAGIGGGNMGAGGATRIAGGAQVVASSSRYGAGIGGGYGGAGGTVAIDVGAVVSAEGASNGAGIGGGAAGGPGGETTIGGNARVTATGGRHAAGIGGGIGSAMGRIVIGGQARVYATGGGTGAGIGSDGAGTVGASAADSVTIEGDALVVAESLDSAVGIGGGNSAAASGSVTITGGTVLASPGRSDMAAIGGVAAGAVKITGGNVYAAQTDIGAGGPVGADDKSVHPLYVPTTIGAMNLRDKTITSADWPDGSLKTISPAALDQLAAWEIESYWPADLAGVAWVPGDQTENTLYSGFQADGTVIEDASGAALALVSPQFRTLASATSTLLNILTTGLNELTVTQDGVAGTATTRVLTFTLAEPADFTDGMVALEPQGSFAASKVGVLTDVEGSGNKQYQLRITGDWAEGDVLRVTFQAPTDGDNPHVYPLVHDVTLHRDAAPPVLIDPVGERETKATASATVTASEAGQLFYVVAPAEDPAPSPDEVKDGTRLEMTAGVNTIAITGLTSDPEYKVYVLAQDLEGLWSAAVTEIDLGAVYPFSVGLAPGSEGHGSIVNASSLASEYPAGAVIELKAEGVGGFALERWDDGGAGGEFGGVHDTETSYTMPSHEAHLQAHFEYRVEYLSAVALDGAVGTATTTQVQLTFASDIPGGLYPAHVLLPSGLSATAVQRTGLGVYVVSVSGVSAEGSVPFEVASPGVALVPAVRDADLHYDSTAPVLAEAGWSRPSVNAGSVSFDASESGSYYFLVDSVGSVVPSVDAVVDGARSGAMGSGLNTVVLDGVDLTSGAGRVVYVVGVDAEGNRSAVVALPLGAFSVLTVSVEPAGSGSASAGAGSYAEGWQVELTASPAKGWAFSRWEPVSGATVDMFADPDDAATTFTMPGNAATVRAVFEKRTLLVGFDLSVPPAVADPPAWSASDMTVIGGRVGTPLGVPSLDDYRFVGWYTEPQALDGADPAGAWDFGSDVVTADMIADDGVTVTLYGAWASKYGEVHYVLGGTVEEPVLPADVAPDRVLIGSRLADAPGFATELKRAGYSFDGWFLDAGFLQPVTPDTVLDGLSATVRAKWLENGQGDYYVYHWKVSSTGVETLDSMVPGQAQIGRTVTASPVGLTGYVYDSASSTVKGVVTGAPDAVLALDLYYKAKSVAVVFAPAGGAPQPATFGGYYDELVPVPETVEWAGHAFLGWFGPGGTKWDFSSTALTEENGVTGIDGVAGSLTLTAHWAAGPSASGTTGKVGLAGEAELAGTVTADGANGASITKAAVVTDAPWVDDASIEPGLDGKVRFEAGTLRAGEYKFTVEYTDSNGLTATADFTATVVAPPVVSGETTRTIPVDGTADFTMAVVSGATIKSTAVTGEQSVTERVTASAGGAVSFDAEGLSAGVYHFWVAWKDDLGQSSSATGFTVTVQVKPSGAGRNVDLADDRAEGSVTPLSDVAGTNLQALTGASFTQPEHGVLALKDGSLVYTPEEGWQGVAPFEVTVCDDLDQCVVLDYSFTVLSVYVAPVAPVVSGDTAVIGVGQVADLTGTVTVDPVHNPTIESAFVTPFVDWMAKATITPEKDGSVAFVAGSLGPDVYEFIVRYTDSNGLFADAEFVVTVVAKPLVSGETSKRVAVGGTAAFELTVASDVTIASAAYSDVPEGATVTAGTDGTVTFEAGELPPAV